MNRRLFRHPPTAFRAKTFWSLNGALDAAEMKRQIHRLRHMGFGGAYLHSRTGLKTEYLSEEWMRLMNVAADELASLDMEAWLYDEDRYPSGVAGGLVTKNPAYRGKYITMRVERGAYRSERGDICAFDVLFDGEHLRSYRRLRGEAENTLVVFSVRTREAQDVYNGYSYFDAMNPAATEEFLHITLDAYQRGMGERVGGEVKGVFTDEPNRGALFNGFAHTGSDTQLRIPYTDALFETYRERWGEELTDRLPELYFRYEGEPFSRTAWRYTETLTELFLNGYAIPYEERCKQLGLEFTGHILHEDNLSAMTTLCGSPMRFYEHMSVPGMDNLTAGNTCLAVPVMVASVVRQLGKRGALSEMYAAIGWQADFQTYKRIGDWHAMLGITDRCTHLSMYTMAGGAKRDFPASLLQQAVWWKDYSIVEDYFARLNYFLSLGTREADVLVIHPVESAWGMSRAGGYRDFFTPVDEPYRKLEELYKRVTDGLAFGGVSYDFGDEEMMSRLGGIRTGKSPRVTVGKRSYPAVLLPGNMTLRSSTVALLATFLAAGGRVVVLGDFPAYCDGSPSDVRADLRGAEQAAADADLCALFKPPFSYAGGKAYTHYAVEGGRVHFAAVSAEEEERTFEFSFRGEYKATRLDPRTGKVTPLGAEYDGTRTRICRTLDKGEEICFTLSQGRAEPPRPEKCSGEQIPLPQEAEYSLEEPNVCVLDYARFAFDGMSGSGEILSIDSTIRMALGLPQRSPEAIQPWFREKYLKQNKTIERVRLFFSFDVEVKPSALQLMWEPIKGATVLVNGKKLSWSTARPWARDKCFSLFPIPAEAIVCGENILEIVFMMREGTDIEAAYLLGDFGVRVTGRRATLTALPKTLRMGDITRQGLPFYGGEVKYRFPLPAGEYEVSLPAFGGALARVENVPLAFRPFKARVVSNGALTVGVCVTQKNMFGPLHIRAEEPFGSYEDYCKVPPSLWSDDYVLRPQGLFEAPVCKRLGEEK